jgi:hypothetical protein
MEETKRHYNAPFRDEAVAFVADTLEICDAMAHKIFSDKATPEIVLGIYDRVLQQIKAIESAPF